VSDLQLSAYADAIERRLRLHRGREHVLSPRDFALVRNWQQAGIPLARVLAAIDDAARDGQELTSLLAVRRVLTVGARP
jgi:hypothetical protein